MADSSVPRPYDIDNGLAEARAFRERQNRAIVRASVQVGDRLADGMATNFSPSDLELVGRALIVVAASVCELVDLPAAVISNVIAIAGQRLVDGGDSRD